MLLKFMVTVGTTTVCLTNYKAFDFAMVLSSQNLEQSVLSPLRSPRVGTQPILDWPTSRVISSPSESSSLERTFSLQHSPQNSNRVIPLCHRSSSLLSGQVGVLIDTSSIHEEVFVDHEGRLDWSVGHQFRLDVLLTTRHLVRGSHFEGGAVRGATWTTESLSITEEGRVGDVERRRKSSRVVSLRDEAMTWFTALSGHVRVAVISDNSARYSLGFIGLNVVRSLLHSFRKPHPNFLMYHQALSRYPPSHPLCLCWLHERSC